MVDEPTSKPPVIETIPSITGEVSAIASAHAPFIYFDGAANFGIAAGVANITLEALRHTSVGSQVMRDRVVVAHLRMSIPALRSLKDAIDGIELITSPSPQEGKAN
jgi:hypothetical protein